ncbi:MAG TPA: HEAT repeat domain-containing protein [Nitrosopumilaceae archaeon]|nr:HEAT repeat domain-containing protein [Nitrosopumilaceae archaeon]
MSKSFDEKCKILDFVSKEEKIKILESLNDVKDPKMINKIISMLDDPEIEVRGEAFSVLVQNENNISEFLIKNLNSKSKNIRGFSALVLANRKNSEAIQSIINLTNDSSSMVRSCALGSLGYLKAVQARKVIHNCLSDTNLEVKKSALKAAIDIGDKIQSNEFNEISKETDEELKKLIVLAKKNC